MAAGVAAAQAVLETPGATILDLLQDEAANSLSDDQVCLHRFVSLIYAR